MGSSTFTPNLGIEQPATGMYANTWGNVANRSYAVIDAAIGGVGTITLQAGMTAYQLTTAAGTDASNALYPMLAWMGTPGATATVTIGPNTQQRLYIMSNRTSDGSAITFAQGGGTPFTLQSGHDAHIYCDGNGGNATVAAALNNPQFNNVLVTGVLTIQGSLTGNLNLGAINAQSLGLGSPASVPDPLTINGAGSASQCQIRLVAGVNNNCGVLLRNDGNTFWIQATAANTPYGAAAVNALSINLTNGGVTANQGFAAPTIQSTGPLYAGTTVFCNSLNAVGGIEVDSGGSNAGGIDIYFGGGTEGIGSARGGGAGANQGGLTLFTAGVARVVILNNGQVGVNMFPVDSSALTVSGVIRTTGGIVFPDGSMQTTAVSGTLSQLNVTGNATIGGALSVSGNINITGSGHYLLNGQPIGGGISGVTVYAGGIPQWTEPGFSIANGAGIMITTSHTSPGNYGTITITNTSPSDERLKRNVHALKGGLEIINQLHPIEGEYNGLGGTREGERVVGVMAQELERFLPGCVISIRGKLRISDADETDLLYVNTHELLFQMLLALQQVSKRLGISEADLS